MQVGQFAVDPLPTGVLASNKQVNRDRENNHRKGGNGQDLPIPTSPPTRLVRYALRDPIPKFRARGATLSRHLHGALHLHSSQRFSSTGCTFPKMRPQRVRFRGIEFAVDVGIKLAAPLLTSHAGLLRVSSAANRAVLFAHETNVTSRCPWESRASRQFPGTTSPRPHRAAISPERPPAGPPGLAAPFRDPLAR